MEFTPIGWLPFPEAAELYEKTWLGEGRPMPMHTARPDLASRMTRLQLRTIAPMRGGESAPLTDAESKDLANLLSLARTASINVDRCAKWSREFLRNELFFETVASVLLHRATGHLVSLPGRFWASSEATKAIAGQSCRFYLNSFWWEGPVSIWKEDVIKAAAHSRTLAPLPDEDKQAFIIRTLQMPEVRRITQAEGRQLAKLWLEYKKLPADETAIEEEMKRMTGLMRTLVGPKSKQTKAKPKAKPVRSESE
jgi:hypothetical protein